MKCDSLTKTQPPLNSCEFGVRYQTCPLRRLQCRGKGKADAKAGGDGADEVEKAEGSDNEKEGEEAKAEEVDLLELEALALPLDYFHGTFWRGVRAADVTPMSVAII